MSTSQYPADHLISETSCPHITIVALDIWVVSSIVLQSESHPIITSHIGTDLSRHHHIIHRKRIVDQRHIDTIYCVS